MIAQAAIIGFYRNGPTYCAEPLPCKFHATKRAGFIGGSSKGEACLSEVKKKNEELREPWVSVLGALIDVEQKIITPEIALDIIKEYITFHYE